MNRLGAFGRAGDAARLLGAVIAAAAVPAAHGQLVPGFYVLEGANGANVRGGGMSADGTIIGGNYFQGDANRPAKWRIDGGVVVREDLAPVTQTVVVRNMSADGSTLVGSRPTAAFDVSQAVRISANGVMQDLGTLPPYPSSFATATNSNGDIIAGYITYPESFLQGRSWRWTAQTGMQYLPNPVGGIDATAVDMTPDGSVIAGYAYTFTTKAMVWRNGVAEFLGTVPGTAFGTSYAFAVSDDGQVVVGRSDVPGSNGAQAVRWVGNEPFELVTPSMASSSIASAVSGDGSLIGGRMNVRFQPPARDEAFLWTLDTGAVFARDYFAERGILIPEQYRLSSINSISADGSVLTGSALFGNGQEIGFVVVVPAPSVLTLALVGLSCAARRRSREISPRHG